MPHPALRLLAVLAICALAATACGREPAPEAESAAAQPEDAAPDPAAEPPAPPPVSAPEIAARLAHGIDLSGHSGTVDWAAVAAEGHTFAIVKATEGMDLQDPAFAGHWPAMKAAGLIRGAYHFYVTEDDPEAQASFFLATAALAPGDLAPVVDVEVLGHDTQPGLAGRLRTFLSIVEQRYGVKPILYTGPSFWDANLDGTFGDHPLWVAEYGVSEPRLPAGWTAWHLWQFQENAAVAGVEKGADRSHVNRSGVDLAALIIPG
jgi:lysozyme